MILPALHWEEESQKEVQNPTSHLNTLDKTPYQVHCPPQLDFIITYDPTLKLILFTIIFIERKHNFVQSCLKSCHTE